MSSQRVADSEEDEEGESLAGILPKDLNYAKLRSLLKNKLDRDSGFRIKKTLTTPTSLYEAITDCYTKVLSTEENHTSETADNSHTQYSSRRRQRSFYQQHIYTIDSVSYILKLSLEEATELVKQNPILIEKYHEGGLPKYLKKLTQGQKVPEKKGTRKLKKQKQDDITENEKYEKKLQERIREDESSDVDFMLDSDSEVSISEDENPASDLENNDRSGEENEVIFRGRKYRSIEELSRGSKLPKSFFSLKATNSYVPKSKALKSNSAEDYRIGKARKKKGMQLSNDTVMYEDLFGKADYSESLSDDMNVAISPDSRSDSSEINVEGNAILEDSQELFGTHHVDGHSTFYRVDTGRGDSDEAPSAFSNYEEDNYVGLDAIEDSRSGIKQMLSGYSRKEKSHRNLSKLQTTNASRSRRSNGRIARRQTRKFNHKTVRSKGGQSNNVDRNKSTQSGTKKLHSKKKEVENRRKAMMFFITPDSSSILPRNALTSTTVVEGLSNKYSIISKHQKLDEMPLHITDIPTRVEEQKAPERLQYLFTHSLYYDMIFKSGNSPPIDDIKLEVADEIIHFSRLNGNSMESLKLLFDLLLRKDIRKIISMDKIFEFLNKTLGFCFEISVFEAKELIALTDNFLARFELTLRKKGTSDSIDLYLCAICSIFYYTSTKILERNFIDAKNSISKGKSNAFLFFSLLEYFRSDDLKDSMISDALFAEAVTLIFIACKTDKWELLKQAKLRNLSFFELICCRYSLEDEHWDIAEAILRKDMNVGNSRILRDDFFSIERLVSAHRWSPKETVLSLMFEILKLNKFKNFAGESCFPVLFTESGINKDTALNVYLNHLVLYKSNTTKVRERFLERIVPVSKASCLELDTFCNRLNLLLCLSIVFQKNFEQRIDEFLLNNELRSRLFIEKALRAILIILNSNWKIGQDSKTSSLEHVINCVIKITAYGEFQNFMENLPFETLSEPSKRNIFLCIIKFKNNCKIMQASTKIIELYISGIKTKEDFRIVKEKLGDLNPSLLRDLWCFVSGKLASNNLENWSRLLKFNKFEDEPYIYTYVLKHSGFKIYEIEKDLFITVLLKNIVKKEYSCNFIGYIRTLETIDPTLLNSKGIIISSHKLQITICLIKSILNSAAPSAKSFHLSMMVNLLLIECGKNKQDYIYRSYAKRIVSYLHGFALGYVESSNAFRSLMSDFCLWSTSDYSSNDKNVELLKNLTIVQRLEMIEDELVDCIKANRSFTSKFMGLSKLFGSERKLASPDQIENSRLYELCCSMSIHIANLHVSSICWIFLYELLKTLLEMIRTCKNFASSDFLCLFRVISLFPILLKYRNTRYTVYEILVLKLIYKILLLTLRLCEGTIEFELLVNISSVFVSNDVLFDNFMVDIEPSFLMRTPPSIRRIITNTDIPVDGKLEFENSMTELQASHQEFVCFFTSSDNNDENSYETSRNILI